MKTMNIYQILTLTLTTTLAFIGSYLFKITADNIEQYLAVCLVLFADGFFGIWAGTKHYGFQTKKALKIPKAIAFWIILLTVVLSIEKGFTGTSWLSETIVAPFLVFQLISILKNASKAGFITNEVLNLLLEKIDKHKDKID